MEKEKFIPPVVRQTTLLELENPILGESETVESSIVATGHQTQEFTSDSYWE